ncbi:alpha-L-rhamnosidase C-terminal domain-containing protein [Streptomyces mirabilis]|uniref:alpha-L-rhamnosidase C-terminal domain-containing protein n=2 Tax=Streptomyces mirabilis TaxID=68239 RepID=UPI0033B30AC1
MRRTGCSCKPAARPGSTRSPWAPPPSGNAGTASCLTGSVNPGEMTSFNHYVLGAVADWLHRTVAGLAPAASGYRKLLVRPLPGRALTSASARHLTPYGEAAVSWQRSDGRFTLRAVMPVGSTATVHIPGQEPVQVGHGTHAWGSTTRTRRRRNSPPSRPSATRSTPRRSGRVSSPSRSKPVRRTTRLQRPTASRASSTSPPRGQQTRSPFSMAVRARTTSGAAWRLYYSPPTTAPGQTSTTGCPAGPERGSVRGKALLHGMGRGRARRSRFVGDDCGVGARPAWQTVARRCWIRPWWRAGRRCWGPTRIETRADLHVSDDQALLPSRPMLRRRVTSAPVVRCRAAGVVGRTGRSCRGFL